MKEDHRSYIRNFWSCEKKAWKKKIKACTGFEPLTSAKPLPIKLTCQLGAYYNLQSFFTILLQSFWAKKIKDRFENLNKKKNREMRKLFIQEGQEVPKGKPGRKKAIHPSSVIPAIPEGVTDDTYEEQRKEIVTEWRKSKKNYSLIKELMASTFPIRRREVLTQNVRVWKIMEDFPNFASSSGNEVQYCYNE